ncbi:MAG: exo-alpha-sialidase, partial [Saprospiraceae bacterium]|nr:exo-alpha-sialidase [Saprospiraceae bacterium]
MKPYISSLLLPVLFLSFPDEVLEPLSHDYSPPAEIKYHPKATEMTEIGYGPFVRTKNGEIVTVNQTECLISSDEGKTWTSHALFNYENAYEVRPERALICTRNGTLILAFANNIERLNWDWDPVIHDSPNAKLPTYAVRSVDGGRTWEAPRKLHDDWTGAI